MSFLDCLRGQLSAKSLEPVQEQYEVLMRQYGNDESIVVPKLTEWWKESAGAFKEQRIKHAIASNNARQQVEDLANVLEEEWARVKGPLKPLMRLMGREPDYAKAAEQLLMNADLAASNGARELLGMLETANNRLAPRGFSLKSDNNGMREVIMGVIDGLDSVTDSTLRGAAKEFQEVFQRGLQAYRAQGGIIGQIDNYAPIKHNAAKIAEVEYQVWRDAYDAMVDRTSVTNRFGRPVTDEEWNEITLNMYNDISTNNASRTARQLEKYGYATDRFKSAGKFARRNYSRLASPKNAKAYLEYNAKFGVGDEGLFEMFSSTIEGMGRDIGMMKVLGPIPAQVQRDLHDIAKSRGASDSALRQLDATYRTLEGAWEGSVDNLMTRGTATMQGLMSANLLGTASISALADTALIASAKRLHGITGVSVLGEWTRGLTSPRDQLRALHIAEKLSHVAVSRFDGSIALDAMGKAGQFANNLKNLNHRVSGLERITQATGDVLSMSFFADLGRYADAGTKFKDVSPQFRRLLQMHNINEADWTRLMAHGADADGFITPMRLPDEMEDLVFKLDNVNAQLRLFATNSPDLKTRKWSTGQVWGERTRGDAGHLLSSAIMQFKSFPVQVWRNHFVPSLMRAAQGDILPLGLLMLQSTFMGAIVVQMKEQLKGRPMFDYETQAGELVMRSLWQAGFAGLIGDAIFKDPDGYRRSLVQEMAGPALGVTSDTVLTAMSSVKAAFAADEEIDLNRARRAMMPFVPLSTLWYTKAALDRMVLDTLQAAADDGFYQTIQRRNNELARERGDVGWWAAGDVLPGG